MEVINRGRDRSVGTTIVASFMRREPGSHWIRHATFTLAEQTGFAQGASCIASAGQNGCVATRCVPIQVNFPRAPARSGGVRQVVYRSAGDGSLCLDQFEPR